MGNHKKLWVIGVVIYLYTYVHTSPIIYAYLLRHSRRYISKKNTSAVIPVWEPECFHWSNMHIRKELSACLSRTETHDYIETSYIAWKLNWLWKYRHNGATKIYKNRHHQRGFAHVFGVVRILQKQRNTGSITRYFWTKNLKKQAKFTQNMSII